MSMPEYLIFALCEALKDDLYVLVLKISINGHVSAHSGRFGFLDFKQCVDGTLTDLEWWEVGEEIIADEEEQGHPVINGAFKIKCKWQRWDI